MVKIYVYVHIMYHISQIHIIYIFLYIKKILVISYKLYVCLESCTGCTKPVLLLGVIKKTNSDYIIQKPQRIAV